MESQRKSLIKHLSKDCIYNIIASGILTFALQVVVYPFLAKWTSVSDYGTLVTTMSIMNILAATFGTSISNARLILNTKYEDDFLNGDFNLLITSLSILAGIDMLFVCRYYIRYNFEVSIAVSIIALLMSLRGYFIVAFRLVLDFGKIMKCNLFGAAGYLIGLLLVKWFEFWPFPFLLSEAFSLLYIWKASDLMRESFSRTVQFGETARKSLVLMVSSLFGTAITYFDRLLLFPVLGSEAVSTYTVASFFGKSIAIVMTPVAAVMLSYYAQRGVVITLKRYRYINCIIIGISLFFILATKTISPFFTKVLYPSIFSNAVPYIFKANIGAILYISCAALQPAILKFSPTYYQFIKEGVYAVLYVTLGIVFTRQWGISGLCVASIIANMVKYLIITIMGEHTFRKTAG